MSTVPNLPLPEPAFNGTLAESYKDAIPQPAAFQGFAPIFLAAACR
jgi:hypothetical protein